MPSDLTENEIQKQGKYPYHRDDNEDPPEKTMHSAFVCILEDDISNDNENKKPEEHHSHTKEWESIAASPGTHHSEHE